MENPPLTDAEFRQMRAYIERHCGIALGEDKSYLVVSRLSGLLAETGSRSFTDLYAKASADGTLALRDKIVNAMTTNETLWFRDVYPYAILQEVLFPALEQQMRAGRKSKVRIWSAACSTGQEPYSIAMCLHEYSRTHSPALLENTEIVGTDISSPALFLAMAARYDQLSISRGLPPERRDRYFAASGRVWILGEKIKRLVSFTKFNLQNDLAGLGNFDVIFCRNVAIYFSETFKRDLFSRLARLLRPHAGHLFVGSAESLNNYSTEYHMLKHNNSLYYQVQ